MGSGAYHPPRGAGEGISYAQANIRQDRYPDAIIVSFDTYGGEPFVGKVANSVLQAAQGMDGVTDTSSLIMDGPQKIPGVGYVSDQTDDPVVAATIENIEHGDNRRCDDGSSLRKQKCVS